MNNSMTMEEAKRLLPGFDVSPIIVNDEEAGLIALHGHEIHLYLDRKAALRYGRRIIRAYIAPLLEKLGHLITISTGDGDTERFLERIGFYRIGGFGSIVAHRLDKLRIQ